MTQVNQDRRKLVRAAVATLGVAAAAAAAGGAALRRPEFGSEPEGQRLRRIMASPNWADGRFHNLVPLETSAQKRSRTEIMARFLFDSNPERFPEKPVPHVFTDLNALPDDRLVWFGHSGFFLNVAGKRLLIDPALSQAFPFPGFYKPFAGADVYQPENMPEADELVITHDHYDHLDYRTVNVLKSKVKRVVCPLGVGAHFARWDWDESRIVELDWFEDFSDGGLRITAVPAQHFSGRTFDGNKTLWAGFMFEAAGLRIYHSGDTSFGPHFQMIVEKFGSIDLALLEDGQYDNDWPGVHLLPAAWEKAVEVLRPRAILPIHNSKFSISHHGWREPLENALAAAGKLNLALATPKIGEPLALEAPEGSSERWWREI